MISGIVKFPFASIAMLVIVSSIVSIGSLSASAEALSGSIPAATDDSNNDQSQLEWDVYHNIQHAREWAWTVWDSDEIILDATARASIVEIASFWLNRSDADLDLDPDAQAALAAIAGFCLLNDACLEMPLEGLSSRTAATAPLQFPNSIRLEVVEQAMGHLRLASQHSDPGVRTLIYLAKCHATRLSGDLAEAMAEYEALIAHVQNSLPLATPRENIFILNHVAKAYQRTAIWNDLRGWTDDDYHRMQLAERATEAGQDSLAIRHFSQIRHSATESQRSSLIYVASVLGEATARASSGDVHGSSRLLRSFIDENPHGPGRGSAMLNLAKGSLDGSRRVSLDEAAERLGELDQWIATNRERSSFSDLRMAFYESPALGPNSNHSHELAPPEQVHMTVHPWWQTGPDDTFLHRVTAPSYLKQVESEAAKLRGFIAMARGDLDSAREHFDRFQQLQLEHVDMTHASSIGGRLQFGSEHGHFVATPEELAAFGGSRRIVTLFGDFLYVSEDFESAAVVFDRLARGTLGPLSDQELDYVWYAIGSIETRMGDHDAATSTFERVLANGHRSITDFRATMAIANHLNMSRDEDQRERGLDLLQRLAYAKTNNRYTNQARVLLGLHYLRRGSEDTATAIMERIPSSDREYARLSNQLLRSHRNQN